VHETLPHRFVARRSCGRHAGAVTQGV